jgi:acylphosphatase
MVKMRVLVEGAVQGVGYRALVKSYAIQLGLKGLVRNLPNGSVELFCEGSDEAMDQFMKGLDIKSEKKGPFDLNVRKITAYPEGSTNFEPAWNNYEGFEIDYGNLRMTPLEKESLESSELAKVQFWALKNEVNLLRMDTNNNFNLMAEKYGSISKDLVETKKSLDDLPDKMTEALVKGLKKYFKQ